MLNASAKPLTVKVVLVAAFEVGKASGDRPGEMQFFVERIPLKETAAFPYGQMDLQLNSDLGIVGLVTGMGTRQAAAAVTALGLDSRFDLSRAYWIVGGIAGVDPQDGTVGSVAWAHWVVDANLAHLVDLRDAPKDWETGYFPLFRRQPYQKPLRRADKEGLVYSLNQSLANWAFSNTTSSPLGP